MEDKIDRLSIRARPAGWPIMHQTWDKLLFLHWPVPAESLRTLIPSRLALDTFEGSSWIGLTPFTMRGIRLPLLPAVPWLSTSHELNVRTYVHLDGVPGVWFFSLDASNLLAVLGARFAFHLPYFQARMTLNEAESTIRFTSRRTHRGSPSANCEVVWTRGESVSEAAPETLDFFLLERYCLYAAHGNHLYRARIAHRPWPLCKATLASFSSTMFTSQGLSAPNEEPLLHGQADALDVEVWPPQRV